VNRAFLLAAFFVSCAPPAKAPSSPRVLDAHDVWFESLAVSGGPILFADERAPVVDAVAAWFSAHPGEGLRPISPPEVRALWSDVQRGKLPGRAEVCSAPPPPAMLTEHVYAHASRAGVGVTCAQTCTLEVVVERTDLPGAAASEASTREIARFAASLPLDPQGWPAAVASLHRVEPPTDDEIGLGGLLGGGSGVQVVVYDVERTGTWSKAIDNALLQPVAMRFDACDRNAPRWRDWYGQPFVVEVDAQGRVGRCEPPYPDHLPTPSFACACAVLRDVDFGPGSAPRRASFSATVVRTRSGPAPATYPSAGLEGATADDPTALLGRGQLDDPAVAACLGDVPAPVDVSIPTTFEVDAGGRVTKHAAAEWPKAIARAKDCLEKELAAAQFDCPLSGRAHVRASLHVTVR
jgi:hypothetical protein